MLFELDERAEEIRRMEGLYGAPREERVAFAMGGREWGVLRGSQVASESGNATEALVRARADEQAMQGSPLRYSLKGINVLMNLAETLGDAGKFHEADQRFHESVAAASHLDWAMNTYCDVLHGLYRYFIPYPISYLHEVNLEHAQLVEALRQHDSRAASEIARKHVLTLHKTMYVGLGQPTTNP